MLGLVGMGLADVRSAVALAHRLVVTSPGRATAALHLVTIHEPARTMLLTAW